MTPIFQTKRTHNCSIDVFNSLLKRAMSGSFDYRLCNSFDVGIGNFLSGKQAIFIVSNKPSVTFCTNIVGANEGMRDGTTLGFVDGTVEGTDDEVGLNDGIDVKGIVGGKLGLDDMLGASLGHSVS